jgi:DTW domain-containing protein
MCYEWARMTPSQQAPLPPEPCAQCAKRPELCVCSALKPVSTRLHILILQHPQEPDKDLGSARLAHLSLPNSTLKIGLSWPNLKKALGKEQVQSSRWAVLYLGSGIKGKATQERLQFVSKTGAPLANPEEPLEGIVVLDGTWSQAKTLWWRNAWLLKLRRVVLTPQYKSLYRELRKEPRRECLSTIESVAECMTGLGEPPQVEEGLKKLFAELLDRQRTIIKARKKKSTPPSAASTSSSDATA